MITPLLLSFFAEEPRTPSLQVVRREPSVVRPPSAVPKGSRSVSTRPAKATAPDSGIVVVGNARFTVITPECIRVETAGANGGFVDQRSMFAVNRAARFTGYRLSRTPKATTIDTGIIRLVYTPDGKPVGPSDLRATIRKGRISADWKPGARNPGNLGGTVRTLDNADGPLDLGEGLLSRDGWAVIDDSRGNLLTEDWVESRPKDAGTDWYLFGYGDDYRGALKSLTAIGGAIPLPRRYLLGTWYSRFWPYSSDDYRAIVKEYDAHNFPLDVMVMDMDWHTEGWTGWTVNRKLIPDLSALLADFHRMGLHVTMNVHPADGVAPKEEMYAAFMRDMGEDPASGRTLPYDAGSKRYLDTLFARTHDPLTQAGNDFWWLDWQQFPYTRSVPDLTNLAWLNRYYYDYTSKEGKRGVSFSRWAGWGDHRYPVHFSGDASTNWRMLEFEVPMTATAGNVGCFFWSHDIGGHNRGRNEESYTRWCQFGALSAALRSHSERDKATDRRPWTYPAWAEASMRDSFHLRAELFPYIYTSVAQSTRDSVPLTRPLYLDFPGDERAYHNGQEYLFGDNLLVAPITMPGVGPGRVGRQVVYFPQGTWFNVETGERFVGPQETLVSADIDEMPLYVRAGAPIPMQPHTLRMTTTPISTLRVRCFPGADGVTVQSSLYEDDGESDAYKGGRSATTPLSYTRRGSTVTVVVDPTRGSFDGRLDRRAIQIELPNTLRPLRATANGKPATPAYDAATQATTIKVADRATAERLTVTVEFPKGDVDQAARRATAARRRLAGVLGKPVEGSMEAMTLLAAENPDPKTREAALGVFGVGVVDKSEAPYLYGGERRLVFYAPSGILDGEGFRRLGLESSPASTRLKPGQNVLASSARPEDAARAIGVGFSIGSRPIALVAGGDDPRNVARLAKVTLSSSESGYGPTGLTDGVLDGYPRDGRAEWASDERVGASCTLTWSSPQTLDRVRLFDRPNPNDNVTSGRLEFSDGTVIPVGPLPNDGKTSGEFAFPAKRVTWVRFVVTGVSAASEHAGLSEFQAFRPEGR